MAKPSGSNDDSHDASRDAGVRIYHNPRCSKSRDTLALIRTSGIEPEIVLYLETPPSRAELAALLEAAGKAPREAIRKGEAVFKELGLADPSISDETLIDAMAAHPVLIERPIVTTSHGTRLCRPPETVQEILPRSKS